MVKPSAGKSDLDEPNPDDLVAIFGANLKTARMKAGLTQAQLAKAAGTSPVYLSQIERGERRAGRKLRAKLANALRVDPSLLERDA